MSAKPFTVSLTVWETVTIEEAAPDDYRGARKIRSEQKYEVVNIDAKAGDLRSAVDYVKRALDLLVEAYGLDEAEDSGS